MKYINEMNIKITVILYSHSTLVLLKTDWSLSQIHFSYREITKNEEKYKEYGNKHPYFNHSDE